MVLGTYRFVTHGAILIISEETDSGGQDSDSGGALKTNCYGTHAARDKTGRCTYFRDEVKEGNNEPLNYSSTRAWRPQRSRPVVLV